ncbi:MAG: alpha/beta hydrolase [Sporolactobacillus sp.]
MKKPSILSGIGLPVLIMVLIFALVVTAFTAKANDKPIEQKTAYTFSTTPTLYIHGSGGGAGSTNQMIAAAESAGAATRTVTLTVSAKGNVTVSGTWKSGSVNPLVQIVFQDNNNSDFKTTTQWMRSVLETLQKKYNVQTFNVVAHSMGNLVLMNYLLTYGQNKDLPQLQKQISIAGNFDGTLGEEDSSNVNQLDQNGRPLLMNADYNSMLARQATYPYKQVQVLNIIGDLNDGSHSDGRVSYASAASLQYLLGGREKTYHQVVLKGANAQHSKLHENSQVDELIAGFLWGKDK